MGAPPPTSQPLVQQIGVTVKAPVAPRAGKWCLVAEDSEQHLAG